MLWVIISIILLIVVLAILFLNSPSFGKTPKGEHLERIEKSPSYSDGKFQNRSPRIAIGDNKPIWRTLYELLFQSNPDRLPTDNIPTIKTNLATLPIEDNIIVWLGHSALYMHIDGKRILVDPALVSASPVPFINKPFKGSNVYNPQDIPKIDYLLITHDHWDHLDYHTIMDIKGRVEKIVCPLGVGAHLKHWGVDANNITEMDWNDKLHVDTTLTITALPSRHFSGRGLARDKSLWVSYMIQSSLGNIFLSGDTGYDNHFKEIKDKFESIELAIMENGQYNENWSDIHLMPEDLVKAITELKPERVMTIHHAKYSLAKHPWHEPLDNITKAAEKKGFALMTPKIGETVWIDDTQQTFSNWWQ